MYACFLFIPQKPTNEKPHTHVITNPMVIIVHLDFKFDTHFVKSKFKSVGVDT
jgi:hypothetical protein